MKNRPTLSELLGGVLIVFATAGCHTTKLDISSIPYPVMVSPILRVGDTARPTFEATAFSAFDGEVSWGRTSAASTRYEQRGSSTYRVTQSSHSETQKNSVYTNLDKATARRNDLIVTVDCLKAIQWIHSSLVTFESRKFWLAGRVYHPDQAHYGEDAVRFAERSEQ